MINIHREDTQIMKTQNQLKATSLYKTMVHYQVQLAGRCAYQSLKKNDFWKVLAVSNNGFYCQNSSEDIIFIGSLKVCPGPLNVLCEMPSHLDWKKRGITTHSIILSHGELILINDRFMLTLRGAQQWQPVTMSKIWSLKVMEERIKVLSDEAQKRELCEGFSSLISLILNKNKGQAIKSTPLFEMARPGVESLLKWLEYEFSECEFSISENINEIKALVGLGPGLTPSGDDFLGAIMVTLHSIGRKDLAKRMASILLPIALTQTGKISLAHLQCAAQGQGYKVLHDVIYALGESKKSKLESILKKMDDIGHTSGWDAMAGVALVLKALLGKGHSPMLTKHKDLIR